MSQSGRHSWTRNDDILAYYVYRLGVERSGSLSDLKKEICGKQNIKHGSFNMRVGNFKALAGDGGLSNWADLSEKIYNEFKSKKLSDLEPVAMEMLRTL